MAGLSKNQWIGLLLLIAAVLIFVPIPFINGNVIGAVIVVLVAIYHFIK